MLSVGIKSLAFVILLITTMTVGCAKNDTETKDPFPTYDVDSPLGKELNKAGLSCQTSECDSNKSDFESIGMVLFARDGSVPAYSSYKMGQCTGFLYGSNDVVGLNSHCITKEMWENRSHCSEFLAIKFPETPGHPSEIRSCTELIFKSDIDGSHVFNILPDYAFFRIRPINRTVLPLATTATGTQQNITVRKINPNPSKGSPAGYMDYARCQTLTGSMLNTKYYNQWADTGVAIQRPNSYSYYETCKIIQGNSGSPVLNARNEVIGFAQSYFTNEFATIIRSKEFAGMLNKSSKINVVMDLPSTMPDHFQYTQAVCVKSPKNITAENTLCSSNLPPDVSVDEEVSTGFENTTSIQDYVQNLKKSALASQPSIFDFVMVKDDKLHKYTLTPKCLIDSNKWDQGDIDNSTVSNSTTGKSFRTLSRAVTFELEATLKFDANLVIKAKRLSHKTEDGRFALTIKGDKITSVGRTKSSGYYLSQEILEPLNTVNWCH